MNQLTKLLVCSAIGVASLANSSFGAVESELVGTWKVRSVTCEEFADGKTTKSPLISTKGKIVFTPEGYYLVAMAAQQCVSAADDNQAKLDRRMIVQVGRYQVSGEKLFQHVELAAGGALVGGTQMQFVEWAGDRLLLESMPTENDADGKSEIVTLILERQ